MDAISTRVDKVVDYTRHNYSIVKFLEDKGIKVNRTIKCPFHAETNPSMRIDSVRNLYHCFSCESSGSYMQLYHEYRTRVEDSQKSFYGHVQEVLDADPKIQSDLGFNTIFEKTKHGTLTVQDIINIECKKYKPKKVEIRTYEILMQKLTTLEDKLNLIALIQQQFSVDYCWNTLLLKDSTTSLDSILSENKGDLSEEFEEFFKDLDNDSQESSEITQHFE